MIKYPINRYRVHGLNGNLIRFEDNTNRANPDEIWVDSDLGNPYPYTGYRRDNILNGVEGGSFRTEEGARSYVKREY